MRSSTSGVDCWLGEAFSLGGVMRISRVVLLVCLSFLVAACSCRTNRGEGNIPMAEAGSILKDVHFAFDKYDLTAMSKEVLGKNAEWLSANEDASVVIEGHCDERGTPEYNMVLGQKRAQAAFDYLRGLGIAQERMSTVSYGEELPLDPRHNEDAWSKNRRAHFRVER